MRNADDDGEDFKRESSGHEGNYKRRRPHDEDRRESGKHMESN
jgi:hypothetical protein